MQRGVQICSNLYRSHLFIQFLGKKLAFPDHIFPLQCNKQRATTDVTRKDRIFLNRRTYQLLFDIGRQNIPFRHSTVYKFSVPAMLKNSTSMKQ